MNTVTKKLESFEWRDQESLFLDVKRETKLSEELEDRLWTASFLITPNSV